MTRTEVFYHQIRKDGRCLPLRFTKHCNSLHNKHMNFQAMVGDASNAILALGGVFTVFAAFFVLLMLVAVVGLFVFWIVMLIDALNRKKWPSNDLRLITIVLLLVSLPLQLSWLAGLVYYFAIKRPLDAGRSLNFVGTSTPAPKKTRKRTSSKRSSKK